MKLRVAVVSLLGLGLALYLVLYVGFGAVMSAALAIGWGGFAVICAYALALFVLLGAAWQVTLADMTPLRIGTFTWGRMVRDSAAEVLPFSQVGGFVIGARATILHGVAPHAAFASTIVDMTTEMMAQIVYVALGVALLVDIAPRAALTASLTETLTVGLGVALVAGIAFLVVQRRGVWIVTKLASRILPERLAPARALAEALESIHRLPSRVALSAAVHLLGWIGGAVGTWIAFRLIGAHVDLQAVIAIEGLVCAIRSAAFFVPNALGVQEAAYAILAPLLGVGPELGLAISLLKRARDVAIGIPTLLIWQAMEGRRALALRRPDGEFSQS